MKVGGAGSTKPMIRPPRKIKDVRPIHPHDSNGSPERVAGTVVIQATIDKTGTVSKMAVVMSIPALNRAALDAVRQWKFTPTLLDNVPVPVVMMVTVSFSVGGVQPFRATPTDARSAYEAPTQVTIVQDAGSLTLTETSPYGPQVTVYRFDGTQSRHGAPVRGERSAAQAESASRSHWEGATLVTTITSPDQQLRTETRYLDGATMVVWTITSGAQGTDPMVSRQIYTRAR